MAFIERNMPKKAILKNESENPFFILYINKKDSETPSAIKIDTEKINISPKYS